MPSGPPAEPAGKGRAARRTSNSDTEMLANCVGQGIPSNGLDAAECFSFNLDQVCSEGAEGFSSEFSIRTAALMLPSSNLEVIISDNKAEDDAGRQERSAVGRGWYSGAKPEIRLC